MRDAVAPIYLHLARNMRDIRDAVPGDKSQCLLARGCLRRGAIRVEASARVVYAQFAGDDFVTRYLLDGDSRKVVEDFDAGRDIDLSRPVLLSPPRGNNLLGSKHVRTRTGAGPKKHHRGRRDVGVGRVLTTVKHAA